MPQDLTPLELLKLLHGLVDPLEVDESDDRGASGNQALGDLVQIAVLEA